jgi:hypothetical protein
MGCSKETERTGRRHARYNTCEYSRYDGSS